MIIIIKLNLFSEQQLDAFSNESAHLTAMLTMLTSRTTSYLLRAALFSPH